MASGSLCVKTNWEVLFPYCYPRKTDQLHTEGKKTTRSQHTHWAGVEDSWALGPCCQPGWVSGAGSYQLQRGERWGAIGIPLKKQS